MSKALTTQKLRGQLAELDEKQIEILRSTVFKTLDDAEMKFAVNVCNRTGLDPFTRQIYFVKRFNRTSNKEEIAIQIGIDGFRLIAQRSGEYAGATDIVFDDEEKPKRATSTIYRFVHGVRCEFSATARWNEYYPGDKGGSMWRAKPCVMLGKCAEALALRKAFPAELSGMYAEEELQAEDIINVPNNAEKIAKQLEVGPDVSEIDEEFDEETGEIVVEQSLGDYVCPIGKTSKGKKLKDIKPEMLTKLLVYLEEMERDLSKPESEFSHMATAYLKETMS